MSAAEDVVDVVAEAIFTHHAQGQDFSPKLREHDEGTQRYWDGYATHALAALKAAGYVVVELPKPGPLSAHHADSERVWHFGQTGEFTLDSYDNSLHDTYGNSWGADELREMAAAALAAAEARDGAR